MTSRPVKKYILKRDTSASDLIIDYQKELNPEQYNAITTTKGPLLVIAGAGTGKTKTLIYRVAYLVEKGVKPENILLLTFTRKAARQMLDKAATILDSRCQRVAGGTFHSFNNLMLRKYARIAGFNSSYTLLDRSDSEDLVSMARGEILEKYSLKVTQKPKIKKLEALSRTSLNPATLLEDAAYAGLFQLSATSDNPELIFADKIIEFINTLFPPQEDSANSARSETKQGSENIRFPNKSTIANIYSKAINKNACAAKIIQDEYAHFDYCTADIITICRKYVAYKWLNQLLDYDDLLMFMKILLESNDTLRTRMSQDYKYIMIDEYQDTNALQAEIVRLIASTHQNVMAVGDDSQSIYSFRGANFKNIMTFPETFKNTKIVKLERNYRSTQQILDLANIVIDQAEEKFSKHLYTDKSYVTPALIPAPDQSAEAAFVAQRILELHEEGVSLNEIAILARSARLTSSTEIELNKRNIPFKKFGGFKFNETTHVKDIVAHLRLLVNNQDRMSWNRVLLLLKGVGGNTVQKLLPYLTGSLHINIHTLPVNKKVLPELTRLVNLITSLASKPLEPAEYVSNLINYYTPLLKEKFDDYPRREKDLDHLLYLAENYTDLEDFLNDLAIEPPETSVADIEEGLNRDEFLTVSTIHSAKGLEWDTVFVISALEGVFPSAYCYNNKDELEEERRLMYVALTRAKNNLYITYPIDMYSYSYGMLLSKPSRFIENISEDKLEVWAIEEE
jgi:DNA helicase-2/ATP-dependent DNA helicase PcrA